MSDSLQREPYPESALRRHFRAREQAALRLICEEDKVERRAEALLKGGFLTVIPCEHLGDEEVLVSHKVYEAFKLRVS